MASWFLRRPDLIGDSQLDLLASQLMQEAGALIESGQALEALRLLSDAAAVADDPDTESQVDAVRRRAWAALGA